MFVMLVMRRVVDIATKIATPTIAPVVKPLQHAPALYSYHPQKDVATTVVVNLPHPAQPPVAPITTHAITAKMK